MPDCLGTLSSTLCQISALKEAIGSYVYESLTLVVPCLHNMFMVLRIFALGNFNIGATKPIFLDSGSPRGGGFVRVWACVVCYLCIVHILNSSRKNYFLCL